MSLEASRALTRWGAISNLLLLLLVRLMMMMLMMMMTILLLLLTVMRRRAFLAAVVGCVIFGSAWKLEGMKSLLFSIHSCLNQKPAIVSIDKRVKGRLLAERSLHTDSLKVSPFSLGNLGCKLS